MHSQQNYLPEEPKTPVRSRSNLIADDLRFIVSEQKPRNICFVDQILKDPLDNNILFFSSSKEDYSNEDHQSNSYSSIDSSESQSQKISQQQEKCQTVKKLFEPKLTFQEPEHLTTARTNTKGCNCDKSKCSKNYCVCYKMGNTCSSDCECIDCQNTQITSEHLKNQKVALELMSNTKHKGCNCKNSNCLKNYCICHQNGKKCSELCRCENCHNTNLKGDDQDNEEKGVRLIFTARKKVKISEFDYEENKENINMNY